MLNILIKSCSFGVGTDVMKTKVKINDSNEEELELPLFDFDTIAFATNDFSSDNKLGQGGFGPVYKVSMQHIAL